MNQQRNAQAEQAFFAQNQSKVLISISGEASRDAIRTLRQEISAYPWTDITNAQVDIAQIALSLSEHKAGLANADYLEELESPERFQEFFYSSNILQRT